MKNRASDPRRLDVAAAVAEGATLQGTAPLAGFERLAERPSSAGDAPVQWSAHFERRPARGGAPELRLHLQADARVMRECQRCLQPVALDLNVNRHLRFVADEQTAAALDADSEDDVLALSGPFDLLSLIEDELLLALPLVPMHSQCPQPLPAAEPDAAAEEAAHPFAALAALKREPSP
jgi:uncharacterized protein